MKSNLFQQYLTGGISLPERPRLLVVDDEPINIQVLYEIFHESCEIFMATSSEQALNVCRQNPPDLILLDVVMPGMDGFELCKALKSNEAYADIPVIFITGKNSIDDETRGLEIGAVDFISKPIHPAVVRARVKAHLILKAQSDVLRQMAHADGLTGIPNRRYFDERLNLEWQSSRRDVRPLSLILIDVDYFKNYNDTHGHQAGDECLISVARQLSSIISRPRDVLARYGGEEFVCLLPDTTLAGGEQVAERLREAVYNLKIPHNASTASPFVTISLGVASMIPGENEKSDKLISAADEQLYDAKEAGRNRVMSTTLTSR